VPQRKAALKRLRIDKKRRLRNIKIKTDLKKALKNFQALLNAKNINEAKTLFPTINSKLNRAANKGIIHKNTAYRKISRLAIRLSKIIR
jgi:small subunit ribosomal protein S20